MRVLGFRVVDSLSPGLWSLRGEHRLNLCSAQAAVLEGAIVNQEIA